MFFLIIIVIVLYIVFNNNTTKEHLTTNGLPLTNMDYIKYMKEFINYNDETYDPLFRSVTQTKAFDIASTVTTKVGKMIYTTERNPWFIGFMSKPFPNYSLQSNTGPYFCSSLYTPINVGSGSGQSYKYIDVVPQQQIFTNITADIIGYKNAIINNIKSNIASLVPVGAISTTNMIYCTLFGTDANNNTIAFNTIIVYEGTYVSGTWTINLVNIININNNKKYYNMYIVDNNYGFDQIITYNTCGVSELDDLKYTKITVRKESMRYLFLHNSEEILNFTTMKLY